MAYNFLPFYIGFRYTRAKRSNHFISFVALISMIGVALGVAVLITVLSVMNGFDYEIHKRIFSMSNQVTIGDVQGNLENWPKVAARVQKVKDVVSFAPFVSGQGMLVNGNMAQGIMISGVEPSQEKNVSNIGDNMLAGNLGDLRSNSYNVILGHELADNLGVSIGDKVTLFIPSATLTPFGMMPRFKRFNVVGVFSVGDGFGYDSNFAYINLKDAQRFLQLGDKVTGLRLRVSDLYVAPKVANDLIKTLPDNYTISNWTQQYGSYFKAISMEKTMIFVLLLFIIAVAAFNIVSSLVMTVTDKQADIAILRTLGLSPKAIMLVFVIQGALIGCIGTLIGVVGGILLALNAPELVKIIEHVFHTHFISASIYFIDYLPSKLDWHYVINVSIAALCMSLVATLYPAWRASRVQPVEALRYE